MDDTNEASVAVESKACDVRVTFVIPAYNEERYLPSVLGAIRSHIHQIAYELILIDNGSSDNTVSIAKAHGARILEDSSKSIGGLRNLGAGAARGKYLVFLDADVVLRPSWENEFLRVLDELESNNQVITGSRYGVRDHPSWIEKHWFLPMTREKAKYINAGHLIVSRDVFLKVGGFDESLRTGEDYELCMRAKAQGISIVNNPRLDVIHEGYPRSLWAFIKREKWHGGQDFETLRSFRSSWPAVAAIAYWTLTCLAVGMAIYFSSFGYFVTGICITTTLCVFAAFKKRSQYALSLVPYTLIYHAYFFARGLSLVERILSLHKKKRNVL